MNHIPWQHIRAEVMTLGLDALRQESREWLEINSEDPDFSESAIENQRAQLEAIDDELEELNRSGLVSSGQQVTRLKERLAGYCTFSRDRHGGRRPGQVRGAPST